MKKVLVALGVGAVVVAMGACAGLLYVSRIGSQLDASSKAYVDSAVPAIAANWSLAELERRASPQFSRSASHEQMAQVFAKLAQLGPLKQYEGAKGDANLSFTTKYGRVISARYIAKAKFQNGDAEIKVSLIQIGNDWRLQGFFVNSPIFLR